MSKLVSVLTDEIVKNTKQCTQCGKWKPKTFEFFTSSASKMAAQSGQYLKNYCKVCAKKNHNVKYAARKMFAHLYPTDENYKCPITGDTMQDILKKYPKAKGWSLDHDHTIDNPKLSFRGYISDSANNLLARADDSILTLIRAIIYLIKHRIKIKFK